MLFCLLVVSAQLKICFGLNKFNGIPLIEFLSGNQMFSSKAGHLKMCDVLEIVGHIWGLMEVEYMYCWITTESLIPFNP